VILSPLGELAENRRPKKNGASRHAAGGMTTGAIFLVARGVPIVPRLDPRRLGSRSPFVLDSHLVYSYHHTQTDYLSVTTRPSETAAIRSVAVS
jgi:hypothetical protein